MCESVSRHRVLSPCVQLADREINFRSSATILVHILTIPCMHSCMYHNLPYIRGSSHAIPRLKFIQLQHIYRHTSSSYKSLIMNMTYSSSEQRHHTAQSISCSKVTDRQAQNPALHHALVVCHPILRSLTVPASWAHQGGPLLGADERICVGDRRFVPMQALILGVRLDVVPRASRLGLGLRVGVR